MSGYFELRPGVASCIVDNREIKPGEAICLSAKKLRPVADKFMPAGPNAVARVEPERRPYVLKAGAKGAWLEGREVQPGEVVHLTEQQARSWVDRFQAVA